MGLLRGSVSTVEPEGVDHYVQPSLFSLHQNDDTLRLTRHRVDRGSAASPQARRSFDFASDAEDVGEAVNEEALVGV